MQQQKIHYLQKLLLVLSIFFALITLLYELLANRNTDFPEWENNIVFALDVSQSMNVEDIWKYSRIDAAKRKIIEIIRENPGNNYALNIFAGESVRVLPFTNDIGLISTFLLGLDSRNITKQWSDIPWALDQAHKSFNELQSWKVILISDGTDEEIEIPKSIKNSYKDKRLELIILGIWTLQGWYIPSNNSLNPYKIYNGSIVISSLNQWGLIKISESMWWTYADIDEFENYDSLPKSTRKISFPYIFLLFIFSWMCYIIAVYINIFFKNSSLWNIK